MPYVKSLIKPIKGPSTKLHCADFFCSSLLDKSIVSLQSSTPQEGYLGSAFSETCFIVLHSFLNGEIEM